MNLDAHQLAAVKTADRQALVVAGPGAGKTRVIVERAAYLIEECKVSPYEIFIATFTRKAAREVRDRLIERVGSKAYRMTIGTFHATALDMLHRFGEFIGFRKAHSTVYTEFETQYLLRDVATELGIYNGKAWKTPKKEIDGMFNRYYQEGVEPPDDEPLLPLFRAFIQRCRENNSYTYGSLLTGFKLLLPHIHQYLKWKHLIIDEAHDTDKLQWSLIKTIQAHCKASLFIVADTDQTIYEWRGAYPDYLIDHQDEFKLYFLETNYRSVPEIVTASNNLIRNNRDRIPKTMKAVRENGRSRVIILQNVDSQFLAELLTEPLKDRLAVLARNHVLLEKLSGLLDQKDVKHTYVGKNTALINSEPFIKFHAFLKLVVNEHDNFAFLLVKDIIGLSLVEYAEVRLKAAQEGLSHYTTFMGDSSYLKYEAPVGETLEEIAVWISKSYPELSPEAMAFIFKWKSENAGEIREYLDWLATYDIQEEIKDDDPADITLMTIHAAKGLEWPDVIVAGCNEGILPSSQAIKGDGIEAERRLMYVAMTRAQDQLILTVRPERYGKINTITGERRDYENPKSRFLSELS